MKQIYLKSRKALRSWLSENHDKSDGIWLIHYKKNTGNPTIDSDAVVEEALCFGWIDSLIKKIDDEKYARKLTPRQARSKWSESNRRRIDKLINNGLLQDSGKNKVEQAKLDGTWYESDRAKLSMKISEPFQIALCGNQKAKTFFESLAPSYQNQFLAWIEVARKPETIEKRIRESIKLLERGEKLGMK